MGATELIIGLAVVGFLLMAAEVFVPGLVLGILGGIALIVAVGVAYYQFGFQVGTIVLAGVSVLTLVGFVIWMFAFPHTPIGRRIMLQRSLASGEGEKAHPASGLLGQEGRALTPLRPAGSALIADRKVDVVAEGELIESGEAVTVVREEGFRIVVRKSTGGAAIVA